MRNYLVLTKNPNMQIKTWADLERHTIQDVVYNYLKEEDVDEKELRKILMNACFFQYEDEFEDQFGINPMTCDLGVLFDVVKEAADENLIGIIDIDDETAFYFNPDIKTEFSLFSNLDEKSFVDLVLEHGVKDIVPYMLLEDGAEYDIETRLNENFSTSKNQLPNNGVTQFGKDDALESLLDMIKNDRYFDWIQNDELTFGDIRAFVDNPYEAQAGEAFDWFSKHLNPYDGPGELWLDMHDLDGHDPCFLSWELYFLYKETVADFLQNVHSWDDVPAYLQYFDKNCPAIAALANAVDRENEFQYPYITIPQAKLQEFGDYAFPDDF